MARTKQSMLQERRQAAPVEDGSSWIDELTRSELEEFIRRSDRHELIFDSDGCCQMCGYEIDFATPERESVHWIACSQCVRWYHRGCVGVFHDLHRTFKLPFQCHECRAESVK